MVRRVNRSQAKAYTRRLLARKQVRARIELARRNMADLSRLTSGLKKGNPELTKLQAAHKHWEKRLAKALLELDVLEERVERGKEV